jgi:hypothetical protein
MWISKSKRPFHVEELQHALAVEWSDHEDPPRSLDHGNVLDPEDLVSVCARLAIIETESKIIRLVHFTTEEFFRSSLETLFLHADVQISKVCLAYLLFDEFCDGRSYSPDELDDRVEDCPFLLYAAVYWHEHYRAEHRNGSGQAHSTVKMPVRKEASTSIRLPIYTDTPIQINS